MNMYIAPNGEIFAGDQSGNFHPDFVAQLVPYDPENPPPEPEPVVPPVPVSVSMSQARQALIDADLDDAVEAAIAAMPEGKPKKKVVVAWEYAQTVDRNSEFTLMLADALELSGEQLDGLFTAAAAITA